MIRIARTLSLHAGIVLPCLVGILGCKPPPNDRTAAWLLAGVASASNPPDDIGAASASEDATTQNVAYGERCFAAVARAVFTNPEARELSYWRAKPSASELLAFTVSPRATDADRKAAARMKAGEFRPSDLFAWRLLGVPPPWDDNPEHNNTWDFYRHALRWVRPLVHVWIDDDDADYLALVRQVIRDWRRKNDQRPGASKYAWYDHAVVHRLRVFCWVWEVGRRRADLDEAFAADLVELINSHAGLLASGELYKSRSNHALEQNSALLGAAILFPEFRDAEKWRVTAYRRTATYVSDNFSPEGFHLEQSPGYHWYVLSRLAPLACYLRANEQPPIPGLTETARRAAAVWPYLVKPNGHVANVGDTHDQAARDFRERCVRWWGADIPIAAPSTLPNPRRDSAEFLLSFDAGYAVFTAYPICAEEQTPDTYVLYKCNAFSYTHYHLDALSFVLYGGGRDWLVDAGAYNYDQHAPERKYVRSARAHNLVLVDDADFKLGRVELVDAARTQRGDFVSARHHLPQATHTRTLTFVPPHTVEIRDELTSADEQPHTYSQLFHVAPPLKAEIISDRCAQLVAEDGKTCVIEQVGVAGEWKIVTGQKEPCWQGWFSPRFQQIEPAPVLRYSCHPAQKDCAFVTKIWLAETEP